MAVRLTAEYKERFEQVLLPLAERLRQHLAMLFQDVPHVDRIAVRPKSVDRFVEKSLVKQGDAGKYTDPLRQIQDQLGARIVVFYLSDVESVELEVRKYFRPIESQLVVPDGESEFGYFGKHMVLFIPSDVIQVVQGREAPQFFELQIKTLFQHAWSEANHDLGYKPTTALSVEEKRFIAFASAQSWGADRVFDRLYRSTLKGQKFRGGPFEET